ncbi:MAG: DUF805 domain-containing protein [Aestuariivirgaceae bacterium]
MDFGHLFFSLDGRINRAKFWAGIVILLVAQWVLMIVVGMVMGESMMSADPAQPPSAAAVVPVLILVLLFLWPSICVYAKRWHDRNKSGWWTLIALVPIVGGIWLLIECGLLHGTNGDNRFGPDPLAA